MIKYNLNRDALLNLKHINALNQLLIMAKILIKKQG